MKDNAAKPTPGKGILQGLAIASLLLFSFLLRCLLYREVIQGNHTIFFGTDPLYHMRRIFLTLADYPNVPVFDFYVNFPAGALVNWPPGFDFLLATLSKVLSPGEPSTLLVERVCAWSIPLLGTITVGILYLISRNVLPKRQSLFAMLLLALSGSHILVSRIGRVDHHVLEVLLPAMALWAYLRSLDVMPKFRSWIAYSILSGACFALSFTAWTGSTMFIGIFLLYAFSFQAFQIHRKTDSDPYTRGTRLVLLSTFLVLLPFCASSPWGKQGKILYLALSWFQFLVPFSGWIMLTTLDRFRPSFIARRHGFLFYLLCMLVLFASLLALTLFLQPQTLQTLQDAWDFIMRRDPQIHTLGESRSLWGLKVAERTFLYGPLFWLLPVIFLYACLRPLWSHGSKPKSLLLLLWFVTTGSMAVLQIRFTPAFSLPLCIYWGLFLLDIQRFTSWLGKKRGKQHLYQWIPVPFYLFIALASLAGALNQPRQPVSSLIFSVFRDIARITPESKHVEEPDKKPRYGILAHWNWGHHLNYLSQRPNIANPFGQAQWYLKGVQDSYRFLLMEDEDEALALCRQLEARYVLASASSRFLSSYARYLTLLAPDRLKGSDPKEYLKQHHMCTLTNRMLLSDGLAETTSESCEKPEPLKRFRLLYESALQEKDRITGKQTSYFKLYERVEGVHLYGRAEPNTPVRIEIPIRTNQERDFIYIQNLWADDEGRFETRLPYATENTNLPCGPAGAYRISVSGESRELHTSEQAVLSGGVLAIDFIK